MDAKHLKNFTPYVHRGPAARTLTARDFTLFEDEEACDPAKTAWSSIGYVRIHDEFCIDVQGAGFMALVEIAERILPASVQKEKIAVRVKGIEDRDGRKIGKKEYAQIRDDVIMELLPMALIRRKRVPLVFTRDRILVFATSAKVCDDVMMLLNRTMSSKAYDAILPHHLSSCLVRPIGGMLTTLAKDSTFEADGRFDIGDSAVFKGPSKQSIRVKDKDVGSAEVQNLLKQDYDVTQLGLDYFEEGQSEASASVVINEKCVFRGMILNGVVSTRAEDEKDAEDTFINTAWMTTQMVNNILDLFIEACGGLSDGGSEKKQGDEEDDDEL